MPKRRARGEGSISWHTRHGLYQVRVDTRRKDDRGRPVHVYRYAKTMDEAVRLKGDLLEKIAANALPEPNAMTVRDLMRAYLENREGRVKARTHAAYAYEAEAIIVPKLGDALVQRLTEMQIERLQNELRRDRGVRTARGAVATLGRALRQAVRWRIISLNPADAVEPLPKPRRELEIWEPEEVAAFLEVAREHPMYALFHLTLTTGMRQGELLALRWADVTLKGSRPSVAVRGSLEPGEDGYRIGDPKSAAGVRRLSLAPDQVDVLQAHAAYLEVQRAARGTDWADLGLVFPDPESGRILHPSNLSHRYWYPLRAAAGVKEIRFHDLRHTYASLAIRAGMDVRLLADRLGHRDPAFTLRTYTHVFDRYRHSGALPLETLLRDPFAEAS